MNVRSLLCSLGSRAWRVIVLVAEVTPPSAARILMLAWPVLAEGNFAAMLSLMRLIVAPESRRPLKTVGTASFCFSAEKCSGISGMLYGPSSLSSSSPYPDLGSFLKASLIGLASLPFFGGLLFVVLGLL